MPDSFTRSGALIDYVGNPARQNLHCIHKHSINGSEMQQLKDRRLSMSDKEKVALTKLTSKGG